jgi:hypothetical protein
MTGGLRPACEATDSISDIFLAQVHNVDLSSGIAHPFYKMIEHEFGFALTPTRGLELMARIFILFSFDMLIDVPRQKYFYIKDTI